MRLPAFRFLIRFCSSSSLPDLIRQSMRKGSSVELADQLSEPPFTMDHRVKPGGDDGGLCSRAKNAPRERILLP
jgi:hypothetical protein